jgi:hypothetical protein
VIHFTGTAQLRMAASTAEFASEAVIFLLEVTFQGVVFIAAFQLNPARRWSGLVILARLGLISCTKFESCTPHPIWARQAGQVGGGFEVGRFCG